jgi:putative oxidoreductase
MSIVRRACDLHDAVCRLLNYLQSPLLLAIRLYWGWQLVQSGWGKLHNLDRVTDFFTSLNLPLPHQMAIFVSLVEFAGGMLFALGLGTRLVPLVLFVNMTAAYWTADREALGSIFSDPGKFYVADPYTFWFAALVVLIFGPGYWALDTLVGRYLRSRAAATPGS